MCACCGALIQYGVDSATDLQAVRYRARANWIGPEPDSVLSSVQSLVTVMAMIRVRVNIKPDPNPNRDSRLGLGSGSGLVLVPQWQRRKFLPAGAQPRHCNSNGAHLTVTETVIGHAKQANNFAKFGFPSWGASNTDWYINFAIFCRINCVMASQMFLPCKKTIPVNFVLAAASASM